jgi:hypothetical protein
MIHSEPVMVRGKELMLVALRCDDCGIFGPKRACELRLDQADRDLLAVRSALDAGWVEKPRRPRRGPPYLAALCPRCAGRTGQMRLGLSGGAS